MKKTVRKNWHASGWRIVGRTGVIRYTLQLPVELNAHVERKQPGAKWSYRVGELKPRGKYRAAQDAMIACEMVARGALNKSLVMLP